MRAKHPAPAGRARRHEERSKAAIRLHFNSMVSSQCRLTSPHRQADSWVDLGNTLQIRNLQLIVDEPESVQGEIYVDLPDGLRVGRDRLGEAAGRDDDGTNACRPRAARPDRV